MASGWRRHSVSSAGFRAAVDLACSPCCAGYFVADHRLFVLSQEASSDRHLRPRGALHHAHPRRHRPRPESPCLVWLLAFSTFFFFALAAVKRQAELVDEVARENRAARGRGYKSTTSIVSTVAIGPGYVSVLVLALYANSPSREQLYARPRRFGAVLPVLLFWLTPHRDPAHRGQMHDDPVVYAAKDPVSQLCLPCSCSAALVVAGPGCEPALAGARYSPLPRLATAANLIDASGW